MKTYSDLILFKYKIYHKGTLVDSYQHKSDALNFIKELEKEDKKDGVYKPNSYKLNET